jgi:drug/metabolite transporter (DMT)-like permease
LGEPDARSLIATAAAGLLYPLAWGAFLKALQRGRLSIVAPLTALEGGFGASLGIVLGESLGLSVGLALGVAALGAVLAAKGEGEGRVAAGAGCAIFAGLAFGTIFVLFGYADSLSAPAVVSISRTIALLVVVSSGRTFAVPGELRLRAVAAGLFDGAAFLALAAATAIGPIAIASVCAGQFATFAAVLGVIFLRERPTRAQFVGIALTMVGISALTALSRT